MDFPAACCRKISSSCPWKEALPFGRLSYYRISLQGNNSIPKGRSHENLSLCWQIQAGPSGGTVASAEWELPMSPLLR